MLEVLHTGRETNIYEDDESMMTEQCTDANPMNFYE
jgi:hypothetical protein